MDAPTPRAPIRLRRLGVHAVALVPEGANLIQWAEIRKALPMAEGAPLTLPRAAQDAIAIQLGKTIEGLLALMDVVKTATPTDDPAAVVPPDLGEAFEAAGMSLMGLAEQFEPPSAAGLEPGAQPMQMSAEEASAEAALALALAKSFKGLMRKSALAMVAKSASGATGTDGVAKAGPVKMTYEGAMKLHGALMEKVYDMFKALAPLFMAMDAPEAAAAPPPPAPAAAAPGDVKPPELPAKKEADTALAKSLTADLGALLDTKLAPLTTRLGAVEKQAEAISKGRPPPNADPNLGGDAPVNGFKMPYGQDLSAQIRKGKSLTDLAPSTPTTGGPAAAK